MQAPGTMPGRQFPLPAPSAGNPMARPMPGAQPETANPPSQPAIHTGATAAAPSMATTPAPNLPPSLLDKPAAAAQVTLSDGSLSVDANNSSLDAILKDLETSSGMTVSGFGKDSRIFGVYGPGSPRDVLSSLLDGAGYNFLMVGATEAGTPREIVLTARSNAPISAPSPGSSQQENDDEPPNNYPAMEQVTPAPVPPQMAPSPDQRPRTPQEMLLELQRLRQQQMQQGQPQPQ